MHIAICDDNVADRRQLERLLKRESDRRSAETGIIYTDAFGNTQSLLANPMQYDLFYIDMCNTDGLTGTDVVAMLTDKGVHAPIVMCCSKDDYKTQNFPENVIFLDKPIRTEELSQSLDHALRIKAEAPDMIELREDKNTIYVTEQEIIYAWEEGRQVTVTLTGNRQFIANTTSENLFAQIEESHPMFFAPTLKAVVNARYIKKLGLGCTTLTMEDNTVFKVHKDCRKYAKYAFDEFHGTGIKPEVL